MKVEVHDEAELELIESAARYEMTVEGLGVAFINNVDHVYKLLGEHPLIGQAGGYSDPEVRRLPVETFPYLVVYSVEPECVLVIAVAHARQRPEYWSSRRETYRQRAR